MYFPYQIASKFSINQDDVMNFTLEVPVLMNRGLIDPVSMATGAWTIFQRLGSKDKQMASLAWRMIGRRSSTASHGSGPMPSPAERHLPA
jgi:uncharacterized protein (DUF111 family)